MMIVIRLNTGNIKFKQRRPRRDTFVDCQRYVSLLSGSAVLAEELWVKALGRLQLPWRGKIHMINDLNCQMIYTVTLTSQAK